MAALRGLGVVPTLPGPGAACWGYVAQLRRRATPTTNRPPRRADASVERGVAWCSERDLHAHDGPSENCATRTEVRMHDDEPSSDPAEQRGEWIVYERHERQVTSGDGT